ncbi:unnamed protein product [Brachionus calyciflorus]|uniref:Uncharacterized protein n=1 Tax=Brachionus calyciflorus TaxID=104777 RepID=A0A813QTW3_9BILA|nr:unnamed protein product [Brachionus calyciflorus]
MNTTESKADLIDPEKTNKSSKFYSILDKVFRIAGVIFCLYFFVVSLNLMSTSFPLIAGRYASEAFRSSVVLTNPLAGLMIGILSTVIVQSSSTSTSIVVSLVASEIVPVKYAIPIIMGSNIGTSITSTLVALSQANDKERFRLSFSGATIHDMFNLLSVAVMIPLEIVFHYLEITSGILVELFIKNSPHTEEPKLLNTITKPLTDSIIQIDKSILDLIASNKSYENATLIKRICKRFYIQRNLLARMANRHSLFNGPVAKVIQKIVNSDLPGIFKHMTGLVAITLGCILTIIVQSSSVFTSTLTPLVGMGLVTIERVFPLTLGSNIGTTITGILASVSGPSKTLKYSMQIALCHTIFNITGILIWYPLPFLRRVPIKLARMLGDTTAEYKWFAIAYLIGFFFIIPLLTFGLSLMGMVVFGIVSFILIVTVLSIITLKLLQEKRPDILPLKLRTFDFLPLALRSLEPLDSFIKKNLCFLKCCHKLKIHETIHVKNTQEQQHHTVTFTNNALDDKEYF